MSTYYSVYAEANVDGKWYSLCPYFKNSKGEKKTGCIYWAQSRFYDVYCDLEDYARGWGIPEDVSEGIREFFHENLEDVAQEWGEHPVTWGEWYSSSLFYVNFSQAIASKINKDKPYKYEGYVLKKELAAIEVYELEEFSEWLTQSEYNSLTDKQKRRYIFHQWNDSWSDYGIYRTITDCIRALKYLFADICENDIGGSLYQGITDDQIRVYIYRD